MGAEPSPIKRKKNSESVLIIMRVKQVNSTKTLSKNYNQLNVLQNISLLKLQFFYYTAQLIHATQCVILYAISF